MLTSITTAMKIRQQIIESELLNSGDDENDYSIHYAFADENDMNDALIDTYEEIFYGILCSGLTEKTRLSFTSSNSSFSECVRNHNHHSLTFLPNTSHVSDDLHCWKDEDFADNNKKPISSSSTEGDYFFTSCTFTGLTSANNGGAILFTLSGTLTITLSTFTSCSSNTPLPYDYRGGGAVCLESGTLRASSTLFISCTSVSYAGGLLAQTGCKSSSVLFCTFKCCTSRWGGGLMTFLGPTSSLLSSRFISCTGAVSGGGFYHDCDTQHGSLFISDTLFAHNCADSVSDGFSYRGGDGFENYRSAVYPSNYSFLFFTQNIAKKNVGHDITSNLTALPEGSIVLCFTTTAENSFCNAGTDQHDWLPLGAFQFINGNS